MDKIKHIHDDITYVILNDKHNSFGRVSSGTHERIGRFIAGAMSAWELVYIEMEVYNEA